MWRIAAALLRLAGQCRGFANNQGIWYRFDDRRMLGIFDPSKYNIKCAFGAVYVVKFDAGDAWNNE